MKEEMRKIFPKEFYTKGKSLKLYAEISLDTLNKIINYIVDKEQKIDKTSKYLKIQRLDCRNDERTIFILSKAIKMLEGKDEKDITN